MTTITKMLEDANLGDTDSMLKLAIEYRSGKKLDKDLEKYFYWIHKAAESGHPDAMFKLANAYRHGYGVAPNDKLHFEWMEKAALSGHKIAMTMTGLMYEGGIGVEKDIAKYIEWISKSSSLDEVNGKFLLGLEYRDGENIEQNLEHSFELFTEAANAGSNKAMYCLAEMFDERGPILDKKKAIFWLKKASKHNNLDAMRTLALTYLSGDGVKKSIPLYISWITKAAEMGLLDAMYDLAMIYRDGELVKKDPNLQIKWMKEAAEKGHSSAMFGLSLEYQIGDVVKKNKKESIKWLKKSAESGDGLAMCKLAIDIKSGLINENIDPLRLLKKASESGFNKATIALMYIEEIPGKYLEEVFLNFNELLAKVDEIKTEHEVRIDEANDGVAHFTSFEAIESMLPLGEKSKQSESANCLRLYNIEYVNDPDEGKRLINFIKDNDKYSDIHSSLFSNLEDNFLIQYRDLELSIYSCSFTLAVDRLDLWRAYGRDGEGVCIVSPLNEFTKGPNSIFNHLVFNPGLETDVHNLDMSPVEECPKGFSSKLYKIKYKNDELEETLKTLTPTLNKFTAYQKNLSERQFESLKRCVLAVLSDILFLYKSTEYENEKEARLVAALDIRSKFIEMDNRKPGKLFVKTHKFLFQGAGSKIIIGPKVRYSKETELNIKFRLGRHNFLNTTRVINSQVHYR